MARIVLFTGDGKGKTTAALGMALRGAGHEMRVLVLQFLKQDFSTGEVAALDSFGTVDLEQCGLGFVPKPDHPAYPKHKAAAEQGLALARERLRDGTYDLYVLDEICGAVSLGLLQAEAVIEAVRAAPESAVVALTGRDAPPALIGLADTATEMRCLKHAMDQGVRAQRGVEY